MKRIWNNKRFFFFSLRHGLGNGTVAPVPSTSGTLTCYSTRFTNNRHVAFGHSGRSRPRFIFHRHFSRRSSISVFISRCCCGRPRSRSCFIPLAVDFRHDYDYVVTLFDSKLVSAFSTIQLRRRWRHFGTVRQPNKLWTAEDFHLSV